VSTKKETTKSLKVKCWRAFSIYIRLRDCLKTYSTEQGFCCSCGKRVAYKKGHAGHFLSGRHNAILFEETCCHLQCIHCNTYLQGNGAGYYKFMLREYGQKEIDRLMRLDKTTRLWKSGELKEMTKEFKNKTVALRASENLPF